jgi:hypothetical protein
VDGVEAIASILHPDQAAPAPPGVVYQVTPDA